MPRLMIDVRTGPPGAGEEEARDNGPLPLAGEDEYAGGLDPDAGAAWVRLSSAHPDAALANFVRRALTHLILAEGGLVLHAACVGEGEKACVFFGPSGAGKSTVCRLSTGMTVASDDMTAIRWTPKGCRAWGLPSAVCPSGPAAAGPNGHTGPFAIRALFALVQNADVYARPLRKAAALARMMAVPFHALSADAQGAGKALDALRRLVEDVPCFELHFREDPGFWETIRRLGV
ncbi:MAG: hypothetical protein JXR37_19740 [Kiritimatiellae bacterium]|nr:hypothetical protein [Kiritimatiellia bacterium]